MGGTGGFPYAAGGDFAATPGEPAQTLGDHAGAVLRRRFRAHVPSPGSRCVAAGPDSGGVRLAWTASRGPHHRSQGQDGLEIAAGGWRPNLLEPNGAVARPNSAASGWRIMASGPQREFHTYE